MRLIDADALKAKVTTSSSAAMRAQAKTACNNLIDRAPTIEPQWIPCSERLPEDNTIVLVTFEDGVVGTSSWHKTTDYNNGFDNFLIGITEIGIERRGVIAWMPLPTPYKGGERSEE